MRPGQNRRTRGRSRSNKGPNPLTRSYESNGPDVKIRGTAQHIAEKYSQLARDAQSSGDPVAAENYLQHAEHYYRIIAAAQEQLREQFGYQRPFDEDGDDDNGYGPGDRAFGNGDDADFGSQSQPYEARQDNRQDNRQDYNRQDDDRRDRYSRNSRGDSRDNRPGGRPDYRDNRSDSRQDSRPDYRDSRSDSRQDSRPDNRLDTQRDDRQGNRSERGSGSRPENNGRTDYRRDRREEQPAGEEAGGLPAFLTNPVRAPLLAVESAAAPEPVAGAPEAASGEGNGEYRTRRRRRTRRGFDDETSTGSGADFAPEVETPPAE
jgi:hypothetical protein